MPYNLTYRIGIRRIDQCRAMLFKGNFQRLYASIGVNRDLCVVAYINAGEDA